MEYETADIAIIGGGIIGMSCAYELARQGAKRIVVFDKQQPASGTTGGSAGVVCLHDMGELYAALTLVGYHRYQQLRRDHHFTFNAWGSLNVIYEPGVFPPPPDAYHQRFGGGADSIYHQEYLEPDALLRRFPWIKPHGVKGGVFYPNQGFIDPYELVALYERLAVETGQVEIKRNTPVLQIRTHGDSIASLVTRRGLWHVGTVLNAAGPWGARVAELAGSELALTPQRIQVCVATAFDDGVHNAPLTSVPESVQGEGVWCRGELGGTLLFGQHHHTTRSGYTVDPDYVHRINDAAYPPAVEQVYRRYWHLPNSQFLNGWCCVYGTTEDGFPIVSRDSRLSNFYHAVGLNGHGITLHAGIARAVSTLLLHNTTSLDLSDVLGEPASLDFSVLDARRFTSGNLLTFELHGRESSASHIVSEQYTKE
ncbi:NAD(P)/FAD-dependent oxidoreductase [Dictyobacter kobayashii]|uniref:FAD-dependent oxidoreductase n=1 Tax=Dictyobacter kobayashii TaxID=2014872 RepID=A0A402ASV2_9CHLR|nr:FAD-binding oxidoreductase [Dictyobacter kobayashii]GCE22184.1 FAD-dependent oxidoreductase [Dictyobacter kobayashii]